jgi:elongation factor 2
MGPLHLEISLKELEKKGVLVSISEPRAVYKESCRYKSGIIKINSPTGQNSLELTIERLDERTVKFFRSIEFHRIKPISRLREVLKEKTALKEVEIQNFWQSDEDQNILIYLGNTGLNDFYLESLPKIFERIHLNGPLCGEKLTEIKITIQNLTINHFDAENAFTELSTMFYEAVKKGLKESELILLEPIYHSIIQLPPQYIKITLSLLSKYSAKIKNVDQEKEYQAIIEILMSVRNSIKFAEDIRSATSGKAFWQNEFYAFMEVPLHESKSIINDLRFRKGLSW